MGRGSGQLSCTIEESGEVIGPTWSVLMPQSQFFSEPFGKLFIMLSITDVRVYVHAQLIILEEHVQKIFRLISLVYQGVKVKLLHRPIDAT